MHAHMSWGAASFTRRAAARLGVVVGVALCAAGACSKTPSVLVVNIDAADGTPPLLVLRTTVASVANPALHGTSERRSLVASDDAADRPGPYEFPTALPLNLDPGYVGAVTLTVDGLDWDTGIVVATGDTSADLRAGAETQAWVTLPPTGAVPVTDGGAGGAGGGGGAGGSP